MQPKPIRYKDLTNQKFNLLTFLEYMYSVNGKAFWLCKCDCGNIKILGARAVKSGGTKSCGCLRKYKREDFTGQKFNRWTLLNFDVDKNGNIYWLCRCDCGTEKSIIASHVKTGRSKSCGCLQKEIISKRMSGTNNRLWRTDLTAEERKNGRKRSLSPDHAKWHRRVFERDDYTCQICCKRGGNLEAHHIYSWATHKKLRYTTSNGVTLCKSCHKEFHKIYTYYNNTRKQFTKFKKGKQLDKP